MALMRVVDRDGVEHEVEGKTGLKVMENLRELDYGVAAICGGMCSCATCHVYVDPEWQGRPPGVELGAAEAVAGIAALPENLARLLPVGIPPRLARPGLGIPPPREHTL